jgi:hypothetical protein
MRVAGLGTVLIVIGVAVRVTAARHAPLASANPTTYLLAKRGWPPTTYDIVQVIGWALLIVGIVVVALRWLGRSGLARSRVAADSSGPRPLPLVDRCGSL